MKHERAALIATAGLAVVAAVFAIWPALTDAPWEDGQSVDVRAVRCETALELGQALDLEFLSIVGPDQEAALAWWNALSEELGRLCPRDSEAP